MNYRRTLDFVVSHPLTEHRPFSAVFRLIQWQIASRLRSEVEIDWIDGARLAVRRGMTGATGNIYCGLHEFADMSFVIHAIKPGDLFLDVGANVGSYTVLASKVCGAKAIAIEPDPQTVTALQRNVELNNIGHLVEIRRTAVGDQIGTVSFTFGRDTMNRVASSNDANVRTVPVTTIDALLGELDPTIIKMDIEGHEASALRGAMATLAKPALLAVETETADQQVVSILEGHGFRLRYYDPWSRKLMEKRGQVQGSNALFVRNVDELERRVNRAAYRTVVGVTF